MEDNIITAAISEGMWSGLSMFLLFYIFKEKEKRDKKQAEREMNYQKIILKLVEKMSNGQEVL